MEALSFYTGCQLSPAPPWPPVLPAPTWSPVSPIPAWRTPILSHPSHPANTTLLGHLHLSLSQLQGNHPPSPGQTLAWSGAFQEGGVLSRFGQVLCSPSLTHCQHGDLISWSLTPTACPVHHQHLYLSAHPISPRCLVSFIRSGLLPCTPAIISSVCL